MPTFEDLIKECSAVFFQMSTSHQEPTVMVIIHPNVSYGTVLSGLFYDWSKKEKIHVTIAKTASKLNIEITGENSGDAVVIPNLSYDTSLDLFEQLHSSGDRFVLAFGKAPNSLSLDPLRIPVVDSFNII